MEAFMHAGFKNKQLERLNRCRISLQATTLVDLVTGNGVKNIPLVFNGENPLKGQLIYKWTNQGPLPISDWRLWQRALKNVFQLKHLGLLPVPLGRWTDSPT
jgi:hypothetical protein